MTLITSISGIRGTVGGSPAGSLTPVDIVAFTAAFAGQLPRQEQKPKLVIGRDARVSGAMVSNIVAGTLNACGFDVLDLGLSTTPTVEMAVIMEKAAGGVIITASHNPANWNALKLLNDKGEFISADQGAAICTAAAERNFSFAPVEALGSYRQDDSYMAKHIEAICKLPLVQSDLIRAENLPVVVDGINSTGGIFVPELLKALGVVRVEVINGSCDGRFAHNPEPLPDHLHEIAEKVAMSDACLGIVVDPDVDRLALICEDGSMFGEEYTLVSVADYVLQNAVGNTVSNLSSTAALKDITEARGGTYYASAVGEVNVVAAMKEHHAVIGGEGNGGIIYPELHYGRDALVGIALFLSHMATSGKMATDIRMSYPDYYMSKNKIQLPQETDVDALMEKICSAYSDRSPNTIDGVKISFDASWVHLRRSNTEPILRVYSEASSTEAADQLAHEVMDRVKTLI